MTEDKTDTGEVLVEFEVPVAIAEELEQNRAKWSVVVEWEIT
jgi:hypothetical protein